MLSPRLLPTVRAVLLLAPLVRRPSGAAEDADARQASYRQAWDSINSMVQVSLGAPSNSALCGEKRMDNMYLACSLL
jgi:hypothetical protein